ncbi:MAG TPA: zinc ribbon domain-containing protein [Anaerolineales bacterium]|nr:zinc ribbon domain-containing protein [Anaerolineales bacterium]
MQCQNCNSELPAKAKFCPECGTAVPAETSISVKQDVGKVKGTLVGQALDGDQLPSNLKSTTNQKVESVESGGTVVGASIGDAQQIGGQRQYGDSINVGDINNSTGVAVGKNNQVSFTQGASAEEIIKAFALMNEKVNALPEGPQKTMAETAIQGLKEEAEKGEEADESKVREWMSFLAETASDAFDVAVASFTNPIAGLSMVFKKVAERAKSEKKKKE